MQPGVIFMLLFLLARVPVPTCFLPAIAYLRMYNGHIIIGPHGTRRTLRSLGKSTEHRRRSGRTGSYVNVFA